MSLLHSPESKLIAINIVTSLSLSLSLSLVQRISFSRQIKSHRDLQSDLDTLQISVKHRARENGESLLLAKFPRGINGLFQPRSFVKIAFR